MHLEHCLTPEHRRVMAQQRAAPRVVLDGDDAREALGEAQRVAAHTRRRVDHRRRRRDAGQLRDGLRVRVRVRVRVGVRVRVRVWVRVRVRVRVRV